MNKSIQPVFLVFVLLTVLVLIGCAPAPTPVSPAFTPSPIPPTSTPEPTAANTSVPTATPIVYPNVLDQIFSNIHIIYKDDFNFKTQGETPSGWVSAYGKPALSIEKDDNFKIIPSSQGGVFYYGEKAITPGNGVYFTFRYTGTKETFTLGFDSLNENGELIGGGQPGYHSVAMQMENDVSSAHIIKDAWQGSNFFDGNINLKEGAWYDIVLGFDDQSNYIIKIWEPDAPEQQITYLKKWEDFPRKYYFISWVGTKRSLLIDDFTVFEFESIMQK